MFKVKKIFILFLSVFILKGGLAFAAVPSAITNLTASSLSSAVELNWTAPSASPAISDYNISYRVVGSTTWTTFNDGVSTTASATVTGLTNNTDYQFRVRAVNSDGTAADSNIAETIPLGLTFSDNIDSLTVGNINGQNGWVQAGSSVYSVIDNSGNKAVRGDGTAECFHTNNVLQPISGGYTNARLKFDFKHISDGTATPQLWVRRQGSSAGDPGSYMFYRTTTNIVYIQEQPTSGGCAIYSRANSSGPIALTAGSWYTAEFETITLANGNIILNGYMYPQGGTRGAPLATYTETASPLFNSGGSFAFGRFSSVQTEYDNFYFYSDAVQAKPSAPRSLLATKGNAQVSLSWTAPLYTGTTAISDYLVEYSVAGADNWNTFSDGVSTSTSATVTGLANNTAYDFRVSAINTSGTGSPALSQNVTPSIFENQYWHILLTGQSLSTGYNSTPRLSTSSPYSNLMPAGGLESTSTTLTGLLENGAGQNGNVETPASGIANTISADYPNSRIVMSINGNNGSAYSALKQGTSFYNNGLTQATNIKSALISSWNSVYRPKAVVAYHGESDYLGGLSSSYENNLVEWQNNYKTDLNAIGGTSENIPLFINQMNSVSTGEVASAQLSAHKNNPGKIILAGPKYQFATSGDDVHLTNIGSRSSGELMGKVLKKVLIEGETWNPLMPTSVTRYGNQVIINLNIPVAPLVIDTTNVSARTNYGFEFSQTGGNTVTISSVDLYDNNTKIRVTLSDTPTGSDQRLKYAWSCPIVATWCAGPTNASRVGGNIRDSDAYYSSATDSSGVPLYNWLVAFNEPITTRTISGGGGGLIPILNSLSGGNAGHVTEEVKVPPKSTPTLLTRFLKKKMKGDDVKILQKFLNDRGFIVSKTGVGSSGKETTYFGQATFLAVKKFQTKYGIKPIGRVGPQTLAKINLMLQEN